MKNPYSSALILHRINLNPNLRIIPQTKNPTSVGLFSASERRDSNSRPSRWQRDALPAELLSHIQFSILDNSGTKLLSVSISHNAVFAFYAINLNDYVHCDQFLSFSNLSHLV